MRVYLEAYGDPIEFTYPWQQVSRAWDQDGQPFEHGGNLVGETWTWTTTAAESEFSDGTFRHDHTWVADDLQVVKTERFETGTTPSRSPSP